MYIYDTKLNEILMPQHLYLNSRLSSNSLLESWKDRVTNRTGPGLGIGVHIIQCLQYVCNLKYVNKYVKKINITIIIIIIIITIMSAVSCNYAGSLNWEILPRHFFLKQRQICSTFMRVLCQYVSIL